MEKIKFYDVRTKKGFASDNYKFVMKKVRGKPRYFAIAKSSGGGDCWRIVGKDFYMANK